jgi:hypothetical protein
MIEKNTISRTQAIFMRENNSLINHVLANSRETIQPNSVKNTDIPDRVPCE